MDNYAITISRQFASMGRSIAEELSQQLNIEYLDRDIVEETAKRMDASVPVISKEEEDIAPAYIYRMYPLGIGVPSIKDDIFAVQKSIIQDYARKESCIIVGRCGGYCLKNHPKLLRVYIYAPYEIRLKNCIEKLSMNEKTAVKTIAAVDKARENYHKTYIPGYENATIASDLCINSGAYSVKEAAEIIKQAAKVKFGLDI